MNLPELVQTVITNRTITPAVEDQINSMMWSQQLNQQDLEALGRLIEALERGTVYSLASEADLPTRSLVS